MSKRGLLLFCAALAAPSLAFAHPEGGPGHTHGFADGVFHPLSGLDHLLVMLAVGLWAARLGPKAMWLVPAAFVSGMSIGLFAGGAMLGPIIEPGAAASAIVLGLALAFAFRPQLGVAAALVVSAGAFHGVAHAADVSGQTGAAFALGALVMTAFLHGLGMALGLSVAAQRRLVAEA